MDFSINGLSNEYYMDAINSVKKEQVETDNFQIALENAAKSGEDKKLRQACNDFESYFIKMMFNSMRKTTFASENGFFAKSNAQNIFEDMLYEEYGNIIANGDNGLGLSDMLYKQLSSKEVYSPEDVINEKNERIDFEA